MAPTDAPVRRRQWEEEFLAEWLAKFHPKAVVRSRVRLGPFGTEPPDQALTPAQQRLVGAAFRRFADALVIERETLAIVEASLIPDPAKIAQLKLYTSLLDVTPELQDVKRLPRKLILLWSMDDRFTRTVAVKEGIEVVVYQPSFLDEYLLSVRARERRPRVTRGAESL